MSRMRILEDGVLEIVDGFLDAVQQREMRVHHLIDDRVEKEIRSVGEQPRVARQPITDIIDRRHRLAVDREEKIAAKKCGQLVGLGAVLVKVDVNGSEDEKVVLR